MNRIYLILAAHLSSFALASTALSAEDVLSGTWVLHGTQGVDIGKMTIRQTGDHISVSGSGWKGTGRFDGKSGYYDWSFVNGSSGRTTLTWDGHTRVLHGVVKGRNFNLVYDGQKLEPIQVGNGPIFTSPLSTTTQTHRTVPPSKTSWVEKEEVIGGDIFRSKCSSTPLSPRASLYTLSKSTDISNKQVALNVLSMAAEYLKKSCKLGDYYDIMVFVDYKSNMNPKIAVMTTGLRARNLDKGKLTWGEYRNLETERQELERRQLAEQQARQAARDRIVDFIKHSGATNWLTLRQLSINPFQFDGKKIIIHAYFMKMLSREEALFHWSNAGVVLSGVPSSVFTSENEPVLLVGVVRGIQAT